jgi:uncharacterized membrane protein YbaN (DUF454 family)
VRNAENEKRERQIFCNHSQPNSQWRSTADDSSSFSQEAMKKSDSRIRISMSCLSVRHVIELVFNRTSRSVGVFLVGHFTTQFLFLPQEELSKTSDSHEKCIFYRKFGRRLLHTHEKFVLTQWKEKGCLVKQKAKSALILIQFRLSVLVESSHMSWPSSPLFFHHSLS